MGLFDPNKTYVTVTAVGTALACAIGGTWYVASQIRSLDRSMQELALATRDLQAQVSQLKEETMTISRAAEIALRTALANPSMRVPDPRNPERVIGEATADRGHK